MPVVHSKTRARECKLSDSQAFRQSRRGAVESKRLCCQCRAWPVLGKSAAAKQEDQLLRLVLGRDKAVSDTKRIEKLIQELSAQPVSKGTTLGQGLWVVRYFRGLAAWQFWTTTGRIIQSGNRAGQVFDETAQVVENYAELAGARRFVRASGVFTLQARDERLFEATISHATLHWDDKRIGLPFIRGKGTFRVLYAGSKLRIFESSGSALAVQVKEGLLQ